MSETETEKPLASVHPPLRNIGGGGGNPFQGTGGGAGVTVIRKIKSRWTAPILGDDELVVLAAMFGKEQEEPWWAAQASPPVEQIPPYQPAFADEHAGEPLKNFFVEQEEPALFPVEVVAWTPWVFADEHVSEPLKSFAPEQEEFFQFQTQLIPPYQQAFADEHASEPLTFFKLEQEEFFQFSFQAATTYPPATADEDPGAQLVPGVEPEDPPWLPNNPPSELIPWGPPASQDDEIGGSLVTILKLDEDRAAPISVQTPYLFYPAIQDDEIEVRLGGLRVELEEPPQFPVQRIDWTPPWMLPLLQGELPDTAVGYRFEQDDAAPLFVEYVPWSAPVVFLDEDPLGTNLGGFTLEQEEPALSPVESVPWLAPVTQDEHVGIKLTLLTLSEEAALLDVLTLYWPAPPSSSDDETAPITTFPLAEDAVLLDVVTAFLPSPPAAADEDANPRPTVVDYDEAFGVAYWTVETTPWLSLAAQDEDAVELGVRADEDSTFTYQPWPTAWYAPLLTDEHPSNTNVLFAREQEEPWPELWLNQLEAVTWLPAPFLDDDLLFFPSFTYPTLMTDVYAPTTVLRGKAAGALTMTDTYTPTTGAKSKQSGGSTGP